jgi:uncharacterized repeat protein (TIGR01451 family)
MKPMQKIFFKLMLSLIPIGLSLPLAAQTVYGVGAATCPGGTGTFNQVYTVNPATGAATAAGTLQFSTVTTAVNPADGLIYYFQAAVANPQLYKWNPVGGTNTLVGTSTIPLSTAGSGLLRMAFAPNGALYAASNDNAIYQINPATGATIRTIVPTTPTGGSGDFAFTGNGDLYIVANATAGTSYELYKLTAAQIAAGGTQTASPVGTNLGAVVAGVALNGLVEIPPVGTCTVSPCFASTSVNGNTYLVNGTSGVASNLGATGACLTDLGKSFSTTFTISKNDARTSVQAGDTVNYAVVVTNTGAGGAPFTTITDPAVAGLTCTAVTCAAAGGAVCPTTLTVPLLQGAGVVTGYMPIASSVTLTLTCTVN